MRIIVFLVVIMFLTQGCSKNSNACKSAAEPPVLFFQIKKDGVVLSDSILSGIKISYTANGTKKYIPDVSPATDMYAGKGILTTRQIGTFSDQVFFIEYANSTDIDTLRAKNNLPGAATDCQYKVVQMIFNGSVATADSSFGYQPVYIFLKY